MKEPSVIWLEDSISLDPFEEDVVEGGSEESFALDHLVEKAVGGDEEALISLLMHPAMTKMLNKLTAWAARKYRQDPEELRQILSIKVWMYICTLRSPYRLKSWCYAMARRYCLNEIRHISVERSYHQAFIRQQQEDKRYNGKPLVQSPTVPMQERELLKKERTALIEEIIQKAAKPFSEQVVRGWTLGKTPREIAQETGRPVKTIYRILKNFEKAIIEELNK